MSIVSEKIGKYCSKLKQTVKIQPWVNVTKGVVVLTNIEMSGPKLVRRWGYEWQTTGKFSAAEDGHKQKYMQKS